MAMLTMRRPGFVIALLLTVGSSARAADEAVVVMRATRLLEEISSDPESGIPSQFLREARGILIMPGLVDTRLAVGRKKGQGVLLCRDEKGEWGDVKYVEILGASVGATAGRMVTDMVIIYRTKEAADNSKLHSVKLGAFLEVPRSLKPAHKFSGPGPDSKSKKNVLTYVRSQGFVVGVTINGEFKWGDASEPVESNSRPPSGHKEAEVKANPARDSRGVRRLKAHLTAITTELPAQDGETRAKAFPSDPRPRQRNQD